VTAPERYFERRRIREAIAFAEEGGIAIHRNFDYYHGRLSGRGLVMERPFVHVLGRRTALESWARQQRLPLAMIQPEGKRTVAHIDLFGSLAAELIKRLTRTKIRPEETNP
jgi:hypothetical protein